MRDACSEHDLLLSLRFAGSGLDCVVRRRVYDLGLRRHVRGCRAGLHSRRNTRPYVLTSIAPDCAPVITGNRPPRRAVAAITAVGLGASSPPSSSCSDERAASSKAKNHLVRPTLLVPFGLGRGPTTYPIKITAEWRWSHLPPSGLQSSMSHLSLSPSSIIARVTAAGSSFVFAVVYRPGSASATAAFFDEFRVLLEHLSSFATPYVISGDFNLRFHRPHDPLTL